MSEQQKILLFTGAGFCHPLGLPTTKGFSLTLDKFQSNYLITILRGYLGEHYNDIEHVLSELEILTKKRTLLKYALFTYYGKDNNFAYSRDVLNNIIDEANRLIFLLKKTIYVNLKKINNKSCAELYSNSIKEIKKIFPDSPISIFTTNYDLTFETAINESDWEKSLGIKDVDFGFTSKYGRATFNPNKEYIWNTEIIEYKKIHGSLDWIKDNNDRCVKTFEYSIPDDPTDMPVLYPGFKDTPTDPLFKALHDQLFVRLMDATICISVGFAFRDPYINNLFDTALKLNNKLKIICFNPADVSEHPEESHIKNFIRDYPNNFFYVRKGIELSDSPLEIIKSPDFLYEEQDPNKLLNLLVETNITNGVRIMMKKKA